MSGGDRQGFRLARTNREAEYILRPPRRKVLDHILIGKLAELLNGTLVVKGDQHVVSGPSAVPSACSRVVSSDHPKDSPLRGGPTSQEKLPVFDSGIRGAQFGRDFVPGSLAGLEKLQTDFFRGSRISMCSGGSAQRYHETSLTQRGGAATKSK